MRILGLAILVALAACLEYTSGYMRVCYYTNWAQYRPGSAKFVPENIDPHLCTHLVYAFADMKNNRLTPYEWNDGTKPWSKGMYDRFVDLKKKNPLLKTTLAVGGWNLGTGKMTSMLSTQHNRSIFIDDAIVFLRWRNFDGINLEFEYPGSRGSPEGDKQKFTSLCREFARAFAEEAARTGQQRLLLTLSVAATKATIDRGYEVAEISRVVDAIHLMSYDMHGAWEPKTGINAPLYARSEETAGQQQMNLAWAAKYWVEQGAPPSKLVIGIALYGHGFHLQQPSDNGVGVPAIGPSPAGPYTRAPGVLAYYEICDLLKSGATRVWESEQKVPYVYKGDTWLGYDDPQSLRIKVDWLKTNKFGGWIVWALDRDDFSGNWCGQGKYPLLNTLNTALIGNEGPTEPYSTSGVSPTPEDIQYDAGPSRRVCYFTNWAQYGTGIAKFLVSSIDTSLCTHIVFAFANMEDNRLTPTEWNDESTSVRTGLYEKITNLKQQKAELKILVAIGGGSFDLTRMTSMLASVTTRQQFIVNAIDFLRYYNFDGLDLDFEYPGRRGSPSEDKHRFTRLCEELKIAFDQEASKTGKVRLLLTVAVGSVKTIVDTSYEVAPLARAVDAIHLMSYDFHGYWGNKTGSHSALYGRPGETGNTAYQNVDVAAGYWVEQGAPPHKLVIGMGAYGRGFRLASPTSHGVGAPTIGFSNPGVYTREAGVLAYYEICALLRNGSSRVWDNVQKVPYIYSGDQWIGYDDPTSLKMKVDWLKSRGFGGWMMWALSLDDFTGTACGQGRYPLLTALSTALLGDRSPRQLGEIPTPWTSSPKPNSTTTLVSTIAHIVDQNNYCAEKSGGYYKHPTDCTKFIQCYSSQTYIISCSAGMRWNQNLLVCDWPDNVQC